MAAALRVPRQEAAAVASSGRSGTALRRPQLARSRPAAVVQRAGHSVAARAAETSEAAAATVTLPPRPKDLPEGIEWRPEVPAPFDIELPEYEQSTDLMDVVVAGAGPSGLAVAKRVAAAGFKVVVVDPQPLGAWPNNYGVWCDEFEAMGLEDYYDIVWDKANVFLGPDDERFLSRPYARVDRTKLKRKFLEECIEGGVTFKTGFVDGVTHDEGISTVPCADGTAINTRFVVDATGHSRKLVTFDKEFEPGYQGAYGIMAEVESHPFDLNTMLFMDWRDDHTEGRPEMKASNTKLPTFLYAMPFTKTKVFLEETSLVARPAVPFPELKARMWARLESMGIKVKAIEEEEYCLIPMGGVLPRVPQRVLGIGGTAGMVHPSTGYMVSRSLGAVPALSDAIVEELCRGTDKANSTPESDGARTRTEEQANASAEAVWDVLWPVPRLRQREFFNFGMEVLLKLNLPQTREFFSAFFALSDFHWQGFLSARLGFADLIVFGLNLFNRATNSARINILAKGAPGLVVLLARLSKTIGK